MTIPDIWKQVEDHYGMIDSLTMLRSRALVSDVCKQEQSLATMLTMVRAVVYIEDDLVRECHVLRPNEHASTITVMM